MQGRVRPGNWNEMCFAESPQRIRSARMNSLIKGGTITADIEKENRQRKKAHAKQACASRLQLRLPLAELERYARSIIQIDAEHVGESGGKRLAIDSEQPQPVFRKNEAIRSWLGIHGEID